MTAQQLAKISKLCVQCVLINIYVLTNITIIHIHKIHIITNKETTH